MFSSQTNTMHITLGITGITFLSSFVGIVSADFHLMDSLFTNTNGFDYYSLIYVPSNQYNCNWLEYGDGSGSYVVQTDYNDGVFPPEGFTSDNPICGAANLEFQANGSGGYDLYTSDGAYSGYCDSNNQGSQFQISCYNIPLTYYGATEQYVCYSYICDS